MANQARAISSSICLTLLCAFMARGVTDPALGQECQTNGTQVSSRIGARCAEDPSCVIVGETHMLEWTSSVPAKIVVVCIHGLGLCARAYTPLAKELSAAGIDGFGVNVRGFGPDREKPDRAKLNCVETVGDVSTLLTNIRKEHPDYKVILAGESMGGAIALRIAAENPDLIDGVVCSAPAWSLLKMRSTAVKGVFELFLLPRRRPGPAGRAVMHQATTDPILIDHWLTDPSHKLKLSLKEAAAFLRFISKTDSYAKRLEKPILIIQGLNDQLVSAKAVAKLFRDTASVNKTFLIDGKGEHLVIEEGRFSPPLVEKLIGWMKTAEDTSRSHIEVINDQTLSHTEKQLLLRLRRLSKTSKQ